jgi:hypothetical protein
MLHTTFLVNIKQNNRYKDTVELALDEAWLLSLQLPP